MFELRIISNFAAAHKLKMVAKKCENLHGHNWKVEVFVCGKKINNAGVLIDFGELKDKFSEIMKTLDHRYLNELEDFKNLPTSSENLAVYIADKMQDKLKEHKNLKVSKVTVWESDNASASYYSKVSDYYIKI